MNKLDFDDMLYEKTITDQTKLDERNPSKTLLLIRN